MRDNELDAEIALLVRAMQSAGFETVSSCEGHFQNGEFRHVRPNVIFWVSDRPLLHTWVREVSRTEEGSDLPPIEFNMFPVWDFENDVVHEDNWMVWIDLSQCGSAIDAEQKRSETIHFLIETLRRAASNRPSLTDSHNRSHWTTNEKLCQP